MGRDYGNTSLDSLDYALINAPQTGALRILHPLFFKERREPRRRTSDRPVDVVGLDVETDATNGAPRLFGFHYQDGTYYHDENPTLSRFARTLRNLRNASDAQLVVWSRLDIQVLIRLFQPTETERLAISAGMSGKSHSGIITVPFACQRTLRNGDTIFIGHYIPGRSLRIGWLDHGYERSVWIYNIAGFYRGRIAEIAPTLGLEWTTFDKETHIIDWERFGQDDAYKTLCLASNAQDARVVAQLARRIQDDFFQVIGTYPTQLVSTGSLADAAVSAMLTDDDYAATSDVSLRRNVNPETQAKLDTLLGEAFSAGFVDQYAIGYFPEVCTADISAAYPHKIRNLPDLRHAVFQYGKGQLDADLLEMHRNGYECESAIIRGHVTIPPSLPYHPITIRNRIRQNYRPIGVFNAAYTLDERRFCDKHGATFDNEEYVIVGLSKRVASPIATVSARLGEMRDALITQRNAASKDTPEWRTYNAQQEIVKVVDNSLYGKTTMTLENMEMVDGKPRIVGYITGDRYNALLATLITARTRTQLADACMTIWKNGGAPIMCMTDALYWQGTPDMLPATHWRETKTAGFFEKPSIDHNFYILKTGQYEYREGAKYVYKLRGIPAQYETFDFTHSFFRGMVREFSDQHASESVPANKVVLQIPTRKLATIGQSDSEKLGAVIDGIMSLKPFAMSTKTEAFAFDWRDCIDSHVWIPPTLAPQTDEFPFKLLRDEYENGMAAHRQHYKDRKKKINETTDQKSLFSL